VNKSELIERLHAKQQRFQALLDEVGLARMDQPGVNGEWSMKDLLAHLTGWDVWAVARLQAAQRGEPAPAPPWPAQLQGDDEINAWIYAAYRDRSTGEVLAETQQVFEQLLAVVEALPDDIRIEVVEPDYQLVWLGDKRYQPGESFDHFRVDHEANVRAWLARQKQG
jgi:hypothetical protein